MPFRCEHQDGENELCRQQGFDKEARCLTRFGLKVGRDRQRTWEKPVDDAGRGNCTDELSWQDQSAPGPSNCSDQAQAKGDSWVELAAADAKEYPDRDGQSDREAQADVENDLRIRALR